MTTLSPPDAQTLIVLLGFAVALFALLGITAVVALTDISRAVRRIDRLLHRRDLAPAASRFIQRHVLRMMPPPHRRRKK